MAATQTGATGCHTRATHLARGLTGKVIAGAGKGTGGMVTILILVQMLGHLHKDRRKAYVGALAPSLCRRR